MPVRRCTDPLNVQYVWDAIKACGHQKQVPDIARLSKIIQKAANCNPAQAELYIKQTLDDGLIVEVKKIAAKGSHVGSEVESYKINRQEVLQTPIDDGYDWYCIECHLAGDVELCGNCHHVFHAECSRKAVRKQALFPKPILPLVGRTSPNSKENVNSLKNEESSASVITGNSTSELDNNTSETNKEEDDVMKATNGEESPENSTTKMDDYIYDESLCSICNLSKRDPGSGLELEEFNYLLNFILIRIKSWVPEHLTSTLNGEPKFEWHIPSEMSWRAGQLFYTHMDMAAVELKIRTEDYKNFSQFQGDIVTMLHNISIFHGVESQEYGAAEFMIRDMDYDIAELQNCVDCYQHSNEKFNDKWFCLPCRKPHKLVFAKQKGYPYWPAKVIKQTDSTVDVRFFGGKYERAILPNNCIKPITTSISQLQVKKTAGFKKAMEELQLHQLLLSDPAEVERLKSQQKPKPIKKQPKTKKSITPQKKPLTLQKKSNSSISLNNTNDIYEFQDDPLDISDLDPPKTTPSIGGLKRKMSYNEEAAVLSPETKSRRLSEPISTKASVPTPAKVTMPLKPRETDVINISDHDDDKEGFIEFNDPSQNLVTSSTELLPSDDAGMQKLDQQYCDAVEKMRRKLEQCKNNKQLILAAMNAMQAEIDRIQNDNNETLKRLFESHNAQISETKKKQWCFNCEQDAIYHCCWNTAYCSPTCQQQHWQAEHKKVCRRKR